MIIFFCFVYPNKILLLVRIDLRIFVQIIAYVLYLLATSVSSGHHDNISWHSQRQGIKTNVKGRIEQVKLNV